MLSCYPEQRRIGEMHMPEEKSCPFCQEKINKAAIKCRYCQSTLTEIFASSKTEKLAELVIKAVGIIPILLSIVLLIFTIIGFILGYLGIKTLSDVEKYSEKAKQSCDFIERRAHLQNKLIPLVLDLTLDNLLNNLPVDSGSSKAENIKKQLRGILDELKNNDPDIEKKSAVILTK